MIHTALVLFVFVILNLRVLAESFVDPDLDVGRDVVSGLDVLRAGSLTTLAVFDGGETKNLPLDSEARSTLHSRPSSELRFETDRPITTSTKFALVSGHPFYSAMDSALDNNMMRTQISISLIALASFALAGCISVNIGPKGPEKSKNVQFTAPPAPYQPLKSARADGAWQNPKNGNSISYLSTCNEQSDPTLESATEDLISAFGETKTLSQKKLQFDGREALDTEAEARVEGVPTKIRALVFKKNGCLYTLSLIGLSKRFAQGETPFEQFVKGFSAP